MTPQGDLNPIYSENEESYEMEEEAGDTEHMQVEEYSDCDAESDDVMSADNKVEWLALFHVFNDSSENFLRDLCDLYTDPALQCIPVSEQFSTSKQRPLSQFPVLKESMNEVYDELRYQEFKFCNNSACGSLLSKNQLCLRQRSKEIKK